MYSVCGHKVLFLSCVCYQAGMLTSSLCMVLELSELGIIGDGCLMVHKVGLHTVIKYTVESEVKQQLWKCSYLWQVAARQ